MLLRSPVALRRDPTVLQVWEKLGRPEGYLTGGFLRDFLLHRTSSDLDVTLVGDVDQAAEPARRLARALATRAHLLGRPPHCVWRIETDHLKVELWPLGSLTLDEDIRRRDFSCNALAWKLPHGPLIDRVDGLADLAAGRLRAISAENLDSDPVRLLRAPRFLATHECLELDAGTAHSTRRLASRLADAPRERVGQELLLLLGGRRPSRGLAAAIELGLTAPAAPAGATVDLAWLRAALAAADRLAAPSRHPIRAALREAGDAARLALLLRAWGSPGPDEVADYAWPRRERFAAAAAATLLDRASRLLAANAADRSELIHKANQAFPALVALGSAHAPPDSEAVARWRLWWRHWCRSGDRLVAPPPLIGAEEVAAVVGVDPGPELGRAIRELTRAQVRGEVRTAAGARRWLAERQW